MSIEEKNWFLNLPKEMKLKLLDSMLKEDKFGMAFETVKILLDAPIMGGGIVTEEINAVFDKYTKKDKK
tara:strand:+ start:2441 stop:2647 length:207 start_codon:yes stop_codon:yes gene_type:complete